MITVQCPICDNAMPGMWNEYPDYPFCSKRCRIIDLGRWLDQSYAVPSKNPLDAALVDEIGEEEPA